MYHHLVVASAFWHLMWFIRSQQNESSIPPAESINCVQVCVDEPLYTQYMQLFSAASHRIRMSVSMFRLFFDVSTHEHHVDAHLGSFTRSSDTLKYVNSKTRWFWSLAFCWEDLSIVLFKKKHFLPSIICLVLDCRLTLSLLVLLFLHRAIVHLVLPDEGLSCGSLETLSGRLEKSFNVWQLWAGELKVCVERNFHDARKL